MSKMETCRGGIGNVYVSIINKAGGEGTLHKNAIGGGGGGSSVSDAGKW